MKSARRSHNLSRVSRVMPIVGFAAALTGLAVVNSPPEATAQDDVDLTKPLFTRHNELVRPDEYHRWVFVGAPLTPNELNGGKAAFPEFHNVYINPYAYSIYRRTGVFPDGTVLLKELVSVGSTQAVSGKGYFMGEFLGLEAAVKDAMRFPNEPGNWAYFSFGKEPNMELTTDAMPTASCNSCHATSAVEDWVFTQYYPVLRALKAEAATADNFSTPPDDLEADDESP